jgi:lipoprotein-anchoring transpeptidase ErfK/SrfK
LEEAVLNKVRLIALILFCVIFSFCTVSSMEGNNVYGSKTDILEQIITQTELKYPGLVAGMPGVDDGWSPEVDRSIVWICSKQHHKLLGVDTVNGIVFFAGDVATGRNPGQKQKVGDMRTPEGLFSVSRIQDSSWWKPYVDRKTGEKTGYGPHFIRLATGKWKGIGIHGTDDAHLSEIGTNASHGCMRLRNEDLEKVVAYCMADQKVVILP